MKIINHPVSYSSGTRVLMLCFRNKDGTDNRKPVLRISYDEEQYQECLLQLHQIGNLAQVPCRIYSSLEERDLLKAQRKFKEKQLQNDYEKDTTFFYKNLKSHWRKCLMDKTCAKDKLWLFDCDTVCEYNIVLKDIRDNYNRDRPPYEYRTKNGVHVVVQPYQIKSSDVRNLLHKNAMMLVGY